jgi:hypothetical protein
MTVKKMGDFFRASQNLIKALFIRIYKWIRSFNAKQHQLTSTTSYDRYPELFDAARNYITTRGFGRVSILSFGCSTGEECFTLRRYFPHAKIYGTDINRLNLLMATRANSDPDIQFFYSNEENIRQHGPYHIIFCLSVLCRWEDTKDLDDCSAVYPFEKFDRTVAQLSECLIPGGIMVIYNSNFCLEDSSVGKYYEIIPVSLPDSGFVHKFDRFNRRLKITHHACIYRKLPL